MDISGTTILITGAGTGIGRASAQLFAERGAARLILVDIDGGALGETAAQARSAGAEVIEHIVDLSQPENVIELFAWADAAAPEGIDIVFNNAGIMTGSPDFPDTDVKKMVALININLTAMMIGTRLGIEQMRQRGKKGVILNTSSIAAFGPMPADPAYAVSKVGVLRLVESCEPIAERFGIRVMAICPGITDTAIVPQDAEWLQPMLQTVKILQPGDIAEAACRIVEDESYHATHLTVENEAVEAA